MCAYIMHISCISCTYINTAVHKCIIQFIFYKQLFIIDFFLTEHKQTNKQTIHYKLYL